MNIKQMKETIAKTEKTKKARDMINRAFATSRTNFGFTYLD